ncbi:MAG: Trimethylguanosine synthase [Caeruleum heppii]|nr:MAG: Trimethylguanosine synthase [Caeruleum heppii]
MELGDEVPEDDVPEGCHHYWQLGQVPWDIQKYWYQRYGIFSLYDEGIWMTDDAWFGVTPEPVANKIASHLASCSDKDSILIDAFCGAGGNAIAFAATGHWKRIVAIEKDANVLKCAKHNAEIYGVQDLIEWHEGDCFDILPTLSPEVKESCVIFGSPPWGGQGYRSDDVFNIKMMQPYSVTDLYERFHQITSEIVLYLPRSSDLRQLTSYASPGAKLKVAHYCMKGASKASCPQLKAVL